MTSDLDPRAELRHTIIAQLARPIGDVGQWADGMIAWLEQHGWRPPPTRLNQICQTCHNLHNPARPSEHIRPATDPPTEAYEQARNNLHQPTRETA